MPAGLRKAVEKVGGDVVALADLLKITPQAIYQWADIPIGRCPEISRLTGVPLADLRPDVFGDAGRGRKRAPATARAASA